MGFISLSYRSKKKFPYNYHFHSRLFVETRSIHTAISVEHWNELLKTSFNMACVTKGWGHVRFWRAIHFLTLGEKKCYQHYTLVEILTDMISEHTTTHEKT